MGNKDIIMPGESRNLLNRNLDILELFFHSAHLAFADQGVTAKRYGTVKLPRMVIVGREGKVLCVRQGWDAKRGEEEKAALGQEPRKSPYPKSSVQG